MVGNPHFSIGLILELCTKDVSSRVRICLTGTRDHQLGDRYEQEQEKRLSYPTHFTNQRSTLFPVLPWPSITSIYIPETCRHSQDDRAATTIAAASRCFSIWRCLRGHCLWKGIIVCLLPWQLIDFFGTVVLSSIFLYHGTCAGCGLRYSWAQRSGFAKPRLVSVWEVGCVSNLIS